MEIDQASHSWLQLRKALWMRKSADCKEIKEIFVYFPKQVYLWGSILEKRDWTRWWARSAGLGALGYVGRGVWLWWARRAGLGQGRR